MPYGDTPTFKSPKTETVHGDRSGEVASLRNREIQLRLDAYHDRFWGQNRRPDASKHLPGKRAMIDRGGQFSYRFVVDDSVPDNDPRAPLLDLELWASWQDDNANSLPFTDPNTGEKSWRKIPSRWSPIKRFVYENLQRDWDNERFAAGMTNEEMDTEFTQILTYSINHVKPAQPPTEINRSSLLRHVSAVEKLN